ncbi:hypothetical protein SZL87_15215 [Exiguobacterium indicum]|uniref:Uncharacterized protein n=1 Tax=Exiguobacterium indicum TaxID=296995 RepID=A0ABU8ELI6_9BACL
MPGSGKTTTAEALMDVLEDRQIDARLYLEGDAQHPADYEGVAYLEHDEWKEITERYALLEPVRFAETYEDHVLVPYRRWQAEMEVPVETIEFLQAKDVYELPFELHRSLILEKWKAFVSAATESDVTYIFECCFLQNPLTVGLIKHDLHETVLQDYVERLATIVSPLRPTIIYVDQSEVEKSFRKALRGRPTEWAEVRLLLYRSSLWSKPFIAGRGGDVGSLEGETSLRASDFEDALARSDDFRQPRVLEEFQMGMAPTSGRHERGSSLTH